MAAHTLRWVRALTGALWLSTVGALHAGPSARGAIGVVPESLGTGYTYLVDDLPGNRARVTSNAGVREGSMVQADTPLGRLREVRLDEPYVLFDKTLDIERCSLIQVNLRYDVHQLVFRLQSGTEAAGRTAVIQKGTVTRLDGCRAGTVRHFGRDDDAGQASVHLVMAQRAPITDLQPGAQIAGMTPDAVPEGESFPLTSADVVSWLPGDRLRFEGSGLEAAITRTDDGWLLLGLDGFQRAYTRLAVDAATGGETWLEGEWADGRPTAVRRALLVKPQAGASFGTARQAARRWESGRAIGTTTPMTIDLYRDGTGEQLTRYLANGNEARVPIIAWRLTGVDLLQDKPFGVDTSTRTWQPLANAGRTHFVMESETWMRPDGNLIIQRPRVVPYIDRGAATPP